MQSSDWVRRQATLLAGQCARRDPTLFAKSRGAATRCKSHPRSAKGEQNVHRNDFLWSCKIDDIITQNRACERERIVAYMKAKLSYELNSNSTRLRSDHDESVSVVNSFVGISRVFFFCLSSLSLFSLLSSPQYLLSVVCLSYVTLPRSNVYFKKNGDFPLLNSRLCAFVQKFWIVRSAPDKARYSGQYQFHFTLFIRQPCATFRLILAYGHTSTFNFNKPSSRDECERWNLRFFELLFMFISIKLCRFVYFCALDRPVSSLSLCVVGGVEFHIEYERKRPVAECTHQSLVGSYRSLFPFTASSHHFRLD